MMTETQPQTSAVLAPIADQERIQALDVIRGFALVGIFLMNVEWFSRPLATMGTGLPAGLTGLNRVAGWFIYTFVQGKFWTMFSLLFGMGFAVMLTRAERAGRPFLRPYLRRIAALAVFGAVHHIFIWGGDILFSYAVGALALLIVLYGRWPHILAALAVLGGLGFIPHGHAAWTVAAALAIFSVVALYLRGERRLTLGGRSMPLFAAVVLALAILAALAAALFWRSPDLPGDARAPILIGLGALFALAGLTAYFHQPRELRLRRLGVGLYLIPLMVGTSFGALFAHRHPQPPVPAPAAALAAAPAGKDAPKAKHKTDAERRAERAAEEAKDLAKWEADTKAETHAITQGGYREFVALRARQFRDNAPNEGFFAIMLSGMFLLGTWFVRSGVMADTAGHLPLFRRLARYALPAGLALGIAGSLLATSGMPGKEGDPYLLAMGLQMIGNLPACLGYVSLLVLALHSGTWLARVRVLAPAGRMALTNYLTQSVLCTTYFYHYGLSHFGMGRALQVLFVAVVFSLQVAFSHWWLGRFRYGPMEWLWRAVTYWQLPAMRIPG